ncbi:Heterokaryon incompatibility domain-containing protein [Madurella fahalii]|uniref:Heterokaryon incompatibility domain-containing protein n=1 Tax=Madurella fahalii TaxID=1157608 RepID=A0ABQ0GJ52_9PEZI
MDHFQIPKGKAHIRIPNLTLGPYARGNGGFEGYPVREHWDEEALAGQGGLTTARVQSFFQNWLYFGCAIEVLAVAGVHIEQSDLLDETGSFISTRRLPSFLRQWRHNVRQLGGKATPAHIEQSTKIARILRTVAGYVDQYCIPYYKARNGNDESPMHELGTSPLPELVWLSIIALGHTLFTAMTTYFDIIRTSSHWGASTVLKRRLLRKGWCPRDVDRFMREINVDGHYYLSRMPRLEAHISHEACTEKACTARNVERATYKQKHVCGSNGCQGVVDIDVELVVKIIEDGDVPVVEWDPHKKQLKTRPCRMVGRGVAEPPYLVISHVWSDGLGNLENNALPECQLDRIHRLIQAAVASGNLDSSQYFWIDTLGVPVGGKMRAIRRKAISMMANIYKAASAVLVLSSTFENIATTDPESEIALGLYFTNWNGRLWTFQEGIIANRLLLQFSDKAVIAKTLDTPGVYRSVATGHCVTFPREAINKSIGPFLLLRDFLRNDAFAPFGVKAVRSEPLEQSLFQLPLRSTSWKSDETICLGTLIGLNLERLQSVEFEIRNEYRKKNTPLRDDEYVPDDELARRRMKVFLRMVKVFPSHIIFWPQKRLGEVGFGWAPASFMGIQQPVHPGRIAETKAVLDPKGRGLALTAPGLLIRIDRLDQGVSATISTQLAVKIPQSHSKDLELIITIAIAEASTGFSWMPGTVYGAILGTSISDLVKGFKSQVETSSLPQSGPGLEQWFESAFSTTGRGVLEVDAVVGPVRNLAVSGDGAERRVESIQIQHGCVASVCFPSFESLKAFHPDAQGSSGSTHQPGSSAEVHRHASYRGPNGQFPEIDDEYLDLYAAGDYAREVLDGSNDPGFFDVPESIAAGHGDRNADYYAVMTSDEHSECSKDSDDVSDWGSILGNSDIVTIEDPPVPTPIEESPMGYGTGLYDGEARWFIM